MPLRRSSMGTKGFFGKCSPSNPLWFGAYVATGVAFLAIGWLTPLIQGADYQLALITFFAAGASLAIWTELASLACLYFLCIQLAMAYSAAGYHKVSSRAWRSGSGLTGILSTTLFGHQNCASLLSSRPFVAKAASWAVIVWELTFPLTLLLPGRLVCVYLVPGLFFHLGVASGMGLNKFLWAFCSLYPALIFVSFLHQGLYSDMLYFCGVE